MEKYPTKKFAEFSTECKRFLYYFLENNDLVRYRDRIFDVKLEQQIQQNGRLKIKLKIHTSRPGILIGKHGHVVNNMKKYINSNLEISIDEIDFKEENPWYYPYHYTIDF